MITCPNKNTQEWKALLEYTGNENMAYYVWNETQGDFEIDQLPKIVSKDIIENIKNTQGTIEFVINKLGFTNVTKISNRILDDVATTLFESLEDKVSLSDIMESIREEITNKLLTIDKALQNKPGDKKLLQMKAFLNQVLEYKNWEALRKLSTIRLYNIGLINAKDSSLFKERLSTVSEYEDDKELNENDIIISDDEAQLVKNRFEDSATLMRNDKDTISESILNDHS